jgi:hypothetical protein
MINIMSDLRQQVISLVFLLINDINTDVPDPLRERDQSPIAMATQYVL